MRISQPAISKHTADLEHALGLELVEGARACAQALVARTMPEFASLLSALIPNEACKYPDMESDSPYGLSALGVISRIAFALGAAPLRRGYFLARAAV